MSCGCTLDPDEAVFTTVCEEHAAKRATRPDTPVMRDGVVVGHVRMAKLPPTLGKAPLLIPGETPRFANRAERRALARKGRRAR